MDGLTSFAVVCPFWNPAQLMRRTNAWFAIRSAAPSASPSIKHAPPTFSYLAEQALLRWDALREALWAGSSGVEGFLQRRLTYVLSLAATSVYGWLTGELGHGRLGYACISDEAFDRSCDHAVGCGPPHAYPSRCCLQALATATSRI